MAGQAATRRAGRPERGRVDAALVQRAERNTVPPRVAPPWLRRPDELPALQAHDHADAGVVRRRAAWTGVLQLLLPAGIASIVSMHGTLLTLLTRLT